MVLSVSHGRARIAMEVSDACAGCAARDSCRPAGSGVRELEVSNPVGARPGQRVTVSLPAEALLKASAMAYLLPATVAVAGAAVGWRLTGRDAGAAAGAAAGLLLSTLLLFLHGRRGGVREEPAITGIIDSSGGREEHEQHQ